MRISSFVLLKARIAISDFGMQISDCVLIEVSRTFSCAEPYDCLAVLSRLRLLIDGRELE